MLLVDVLAIADLELLAARKLDLAQAIVVDGLSIQLDGAGGAAAFLKNGVVHGEQIARARLEFLLADDALDGGIDADLRYLAVQRYLDAAICVPHDARHEEQKSTAHHDDRVRPTVISTIAVAGATTPAKALRPTQVLCVTATRRFTGAGEAPVRVLAIARLVLGGIGGGVVRQWFSRPSNVIYVQRRRLGLLPRSLDGGPRGLFVLAHEGAEHALRLSELLAQGTTALVEGL
ncbi:Uncharacterised protein [Collinsella intestinalis]|nr:Uncharacterised protein [Collinsella intestinalis]